LGYWRRSWGWGSDFILDFKFPEDIGDSCSLLSGYIDPLGNIEALLVKAVLPLRSKGAEMLSLDLLGDSSLCFFVCILSRRKNLMLRSPTST
jgi:hypothetical protein